MNKNIIRIAFLAVVSVLANSCKEEPLFSEHYDIMLPAAAITSISDEAPFVGEQIAFTGTNLNTVNSVAIGAYTFKIISQSADSLVVEVPRIVESGPITIMNKYKREFVTAQLLKPQFYEAVVTSWPVNIERGKAFMLKGVNLDLIKEVKIAGKVVAVFGTATSEKVSYSSAGVELGVEAVIEVTPKTGDKQTSLAIPVVAPKNTYVPKQTIMLFDFETAPVVVAGDATQPFTQELVSNGFFNKGYKVTADAGNGWNGIYTKLENTNGGQGFDLSAYSKPTLTFLVNTNGGQGYVQPLLTINGSTNDKHLTGAFGYGDDYKISTAGWEWRSYDLEKLGYADIKGLVTNFTMQFRGGNVNGTPFEIMIDQVMITDGPVTPTLIWDAETAGGGDLNITFNDGDNLTGYYQGSQYASYKYTVGGDTWAWLGNIMNVDNLALDPIAYNNGIYLNFLVNTGDSEGYAGIQIVQGSNKLANQKLDPAYGDNYKFRPTNGNWEWRSMKFDKTTMDVWGGSADDFDLSKAFSMSFYARGGNIASGVNAQLHMDYFIFTTVPLDPTLVSE